MTNVQLFASRELALPIIEKAMGVNLAEEGDRIATYTAALLRRLVGILGPCSRREVVSRAKQALAQYVTTDLDALIRGALEDIIIGGDVLEIPVLVDDAGEDPCLRLIGAPPSFVLCDQRVRITGIAPDDANFLPTELLRSIKARGGDRFIDTDDTAELIQLLKSLGLRPVDLDRWIGKTRDVPAEVFVGRVTKRLAQSGRTGDLPNASWLLPADEHQKPYRSRWSTGPAPDAPAIVRAPQRYGNPRWYFAEARDKSLRILDLPVEGELATRGCDYAWSVQLALDYVGGFPARYKMQATNAEWTEIRVAFPLPLNIRRRLMHLGGYRSDEGQGFTFQIPTSDLPSAEAILAGAWMVPSDNRKS